MGSVPAPKYMMPSAPYGASQGTNVVNPVQPLVKNPQQQLLPPGFQAQGNNTLMNPNFYGSGQ